jgi:Arginine deiminase
MSAREPTDEVVSCDGLGGHPRLGSGCLLIGMGEQTRPAGVELLARRLFEAGAAERIIAVSMPELRGDLVAYSLTAVPNGRRVEREDDLFTAIARALEPPAAAVRDRRRPLRGRARAVIARDA